MKGQIVKIISNDYFVSSNNEEFICKARGKFKKDNIIPKVGDYVIFNKDSLIIEKISKRKNELDRPCVSNIDRAFIVTSLKNPEFSSNLLDKLLIICELNNIEPIICLTKKDLLTKNELKEIKKIVNYYRNIGYKVIYNTNLFRIKRMFKNKTTVFTGQTGAGKSSLINKLDKNLNFETNEISKALGRGKHTTRYSELISLLDGLVADTPGFSSLDLSSMKKEEIRDNFIEFNEYKQNCRYSDCMHLKEDECGIKNEVGKEILKSRYENYEKLIKENL